MTKDIKAQELIKKQEEERVKELEVKQELFVKEYEELSKKHQLQIIPILRSNLSSIQAVLDVRPIPQVKE